MATKTVRLFSFHARPPTAGPRDTIFASQDSEAPNLLRLRRSHEAPHRLALNSIASRFKVSPKMRTVASFDFCNRIPPRADIAQRSRPVRLVPTAITNE
jgi:hypothetical protein